MSTPTKPIRWPVRKGVGTRDLTDPSTWPKTPNLQLIQPPAGARGWADEANANWSILDTAAATQSDWLATSGIALILNKPVIPAAQVNSDWLASSGVAKILNQPTLAPSATTDTTNAANITSGVLALARVPTIPYTQVSGLSVAAHSGSYTDLLNLPVLPVNNPATANQFLTAYNSATGAFSKAQPTAANISGLATVASSGSYTDLSNKPTIPAAQVNSDWLASSGVAQILNRPTLAPSATTDTTNAANITSGVLPHAQLPALLAADIPTTLNATNFIANMGLTQSVAATSGANQSSPTESIQGNYWTGSASAADSWSLKDNLGAGANPTSTLAITHSGSTGLATVTMPNLSVTGGTAPAVGAPTFAGTGLNDMSAGGTAASVLTQTLKVQIITAGTPDQFQWSMDGGTSWQGPINITGTSQNLSYISMTVTFAATTGHTVGDNWTVVATPSSSNLNFVNAIYLNGSPFIGQTGNNNLFIGTQTLGTYPSGNKASGYFNLAIGVRALSALTSGLGNVAVGAQVLMNLTTGGGNVGVGGYVNGACLNVVTTGSNNTCVGTAALKALTTGGSNTVVGNGVAPALVTDSNNTLIGAGVLAAATSGANNTMMGFSAGGSIPSTTGSVFIGYYAGYYQTASNIFALSGTKQTTLAGEQTYDLLYGQFAAGANSLTNQFLTVNGKLGINTITPKSNLSVPGLPIYATNAAAITGGLQVGDFFRNGADPDVVMVVH